MNVNTISLFSIPFRLLLCLLAGWLMAGPGCIGTGTVHSVTPLERRFDDGVEYSIKRVHTLESTIFHFSFSTFHIYSRDHIYFLSFFHLIIFRKVHLFFSFFLLCIHFPQNFPFFFFHHNFIYFYHFQIKLYVCTWICSENAVLIYTLIFKVSAPATVESSHTKYGLNLHTYAYMYVWRWEWVDCNRRGVEHFKNANWVESIKSWKCSVQMRVRAIIGENEYWNMKWHFFLFFLIQIPPNLFIHGHQLIILYTNQMQKVN